MNLYIDCEWTKWDGKLISMALVPEYSQYRIFYEAIEFDVDDCDPWVVQNVLPVMDIDPVPLNTFHYRLSEYLRMFDNIHVIGDWPEDIAWFCRALITGPGMRMDTPSVTMQIIRVDTVSEKPHNAMYDAIAIRNHFVLESDKR